MDQLEQARIMINEVDQGMAKLFVRRMEAAQMVAAYKREHGLAVLDEARERSVIESRLPYVEDETLKSYYVRFLQDVMDVSKMYQHRLMEGLRVAYSGVEGAFAHIAASRIFPDGTPVAFSDFAEAYAAVERGECDVCVLPVENSYAGEVAQVMDLIFNGSLFVNGMYTLPVAHNLLGIPGATLEDIQRVISHPQALGQCAGYIERHNFEVIQASNTARAARTVRETGDKHVAAIASAETAELYDLTILEKNINESSFNTTRFAVFSRAANNKPQSSFLLLFTVNHVAGALARAINIIGNHGFNLRVLRSRPMKELPWQYYFYAEAEGDDQSESGHRMLRELSEHCNVMKIAGRFPADISLKEE